MTNYSATVSYQTEKEKNEIESWNQQIPDLLFCNAQFLQAFSCALLEPRKNKGGNCQVL